MMQLCPPIYRKTQGYCRRVEGVNIVGYEEILYCPTLLSCNGNRLVRKLLEYLYLAYFICLAQIASAYILAKAKVMKG